MSDLNLQQDIQLRLHTLRQRLAKRPSDAVLYNQLGLTFAAAGKIAEALTAFDQAVSLSATYAEAHLNRGLALEMLDREADALAASTRASVLTPLFTEAEGRVRAVAAHLHLPSPPSPWPRPASSFRNFVARLRRGGFAQRLLTDNPKRAKEEDWRLALEGDRTNPAFLAGLAALLIRKERFVEAEAFLRFMLLHDPKNVDAGVTLAEMFEQLNRAEEGLAILESVVAAGGDRARAAPVLLRLKQTLCDWRGYDALSAETLAVIRRAPASVQPFAALSTTATATDQRGCAVAQARKFTRGIEPLDPRPATRRDRITVGYMSADFHQHAVATLVAGLFENHDRAKFHVIGYPLWMDDGSPVRARIAGGCDRFVDLWGVDSVTGAQQIATDEVDILVDLTGYTANYRADILAYHPAPVQVGYLGYPGTLGASFMDYIFTDAVLTPPGHEDDFTEKIIRLPTYQINDNKRAHPAPRVHRRDLGLPDNATVFCSFNGPKKITPEVFARWMRILAAVPGSVLWLAGGSPISMDNLGREAAAAGIAPERLVFTTWTASYVDHLARYALADLFLDTLPYSAHTTASDALWMGCPLLTCAGDVFQARVGASALHGAGLDDLITTSLDDYEALAIRLGNDRARLASLKKQLGEKRQVLPLFNTARTVRALEAAYERMWETCLAGRAPESFSVNS